MNAIAHIAVIDDDPSVRQSLQRLITAAGFDVSVYGSADAFLRSQHFRDAGCLLVDIQMPGLTGLDLQDIIEALRHPIPIVFITAIRDESLRSRALAGGAIGFLEKPFDDQALISLIQKAFESTASKADETL